ncbi:VWA domain-containing protein [Halobacillus yeomjeoni]|uniref:VWA domain-containing protein n=1 Tax=Halobacillus yeomjeoni TaxID=311194 RepID=A0A931MX07_9BACI|nr:VWA domain-containing protein [Halobacillus yeomjeoni]MBH0231825.1 VWA domain-containing protein [Halobacillus yeomjeoni]MCA0985620.1 VWA domain-containing protein [Halobacillus yeomjeoni]
MKPGRLKQILLLTDGCSNHGEDPIAVAALARNQGVTVNVIGVLDDRQHSKPQGLDEIESIAEAGGGISQIVYQKSLSQTVQMVTRQAMTQTIQGVVNKELQEILGKDQTIEELPLDKRAEVVEVVDDLGETCDLEVLVLVDTSASMNHKLPTVKDALYDLSLSLNARTGSNQFCVYVFPDTKKTIKKMIDWTPELEKIHGIFSKISSGGYTPTGPALKEALYAFTEKPFFHSMQDGVDPYEETGL